MADDRHDVAVDIVARSVIVAVCDRDTLLQAHAAFPELDFTVFAEVIDRVVAIASSRGVSADEYSAAVDYLTPTGDPA